VWVLNNAGIDGHSSAAVHPVGIFINTATNNKINTVPVTL
jgi:hypothetical protein